MFADVLGAEFVRPAFAAPGDWSSWFLLVAVIAYSLQIYMDVSGYTDIARGTARCFGYDLMLNFDRPYLARSVSNFWQRWHISVSSFFRDYLYFGLGGSRRGNVYLNLLLTFVAIGLWHGAGWNFVLYGCVHGSMVCCERWRRQRTPPDERPGRAHARAASARHVPVRRVFADPVRRDGPARCRGVRASILTGAGSGGAADTRAYLALALAAILHVVPRSWEAVVADRFFRAPAWRQGVAYVAGRARADRVDDRPAAVRLLPLLIGHAASGRRPVDRLVDPDVARRRADDAEEDVVVGCVLPFAEHAALRCRRAGDW